MKKASALSTLFGLALLAGLLYALWYVARASVALFNRADLFNGVSREVGVITVSSVLTVLVAAWMVSRGLHAVARSGELVRQRTARAGAYEAFLRLHSETASPALPFRVAGKEDASGQLLLHASPAVIAEYARLRRAEASGAAAGDEMVELIRAMRRDLGQRAPDAPVADLAELIGGPVRERVG
ncbi:MAG TPA: hypothetical protein VFY65_06330 [Longimicrobium sp.]|nr:hypothetical protein [Longimicrobium sp.]